MVEMNKASLKDSKSMTFCENPFFRMIWRIQAVETDSLTAAPYSL